MFNIAKKFFAQFSNKPTVIEDQSSRDQTSVKDTLFSVSDLAAYFNISAQELNEIFQKLGWAQKEDRWWIATSKGISKGAVQQYNARSKNKYIVWPASIKLERELMTTVQNLKNTKKSFVEPVVTYEKFKESNTTTKLSALEKKQKGSAYEMFVADHFRVRGYTIAEHGKDNGVKDHGIDIIAKKDKEIIFIQCKNWSARSTYKVRDKEIKVTRQDARDYMMKNPLYVSGGYKMKILYVMAENVLHPSAYNYIQEHHDILDFQIIPMLNSNS